MTESRNASDPLLTEEAYARSTGKAVIPAPGPLIDSEVYIQRRVRQEAERNPNAPYGRVGDRQRFYSEWAEYLYIPWMKDTHAWQEWLEGYFQWRQKQAKLNKSANNGTQLGPREFTFTYGNHFESPEEAKRVMTQAIERLTRYYKDEIIEFHAVGEYTQAGRPHVHGWYHLENGLKITDKNFKRAYPPWNPKKKLGRGFEGGHHATIERVSDFHGYTEKHLEEAWLITNINNDGHEELLRTQAQIDDSRSPPSSPSSSGTQEEDSRSPSPQGRRTDCQVSYESSDGDSVRG